MAKLVGKIPVYKVFFNVLNLFFSRPFSLEESTIVMDFRQFCFRYT